MWKFSDDKTAAVITAEEHSKSSHEFYNGGLPETAVLFYMHSGVEYTKHHDSSILIAGRLPTFLNARQVYGLKDCGVCFLHGGWGAPMAADTLETLSALGVKNIISVGMCGAFAENVNSGDILIPDRAFSEEGTSLHYYENADCFYPNELLHKRALECIPNAKSRPIVTTDAVYRQTFYKERLWREKGAVGVDMETSALFSVGKYLGVNAVSVLIVSDRHPLREKGGHWSWKMTEEMRYAFFEKCINFAKQIGG